MLCGRCRKIQVFDASGKQVDKRDVQADKTDAALLSVSLPALQPGKYKVVWRVVSVDTHVTTGNFAFEVTHSSLGGSATKSGAVKKPGRRFV